MRSKDTFPMKTKGDVCLQTTLQDGNDVANLIGGTSQLEPWHKPFGLLNYMDLKKIGTYKTKRQNRKMRNLLPSKKN